MPVHPHARGERVSRTWMPRSLAGSSPRPWGTGRWRTAIGQEGRFIPTPVGNGPLSPSWRWRGAVHPHARGERVEFLVLPDTRPGSSPRPWGTGEVGRNKDLPSRFIPTPVGNGRPAPGCNRPMPVHPHARGERYSRSVAGHREVGSSPRPWGTAATNRRQTTLLRFIPTPVGNGRWSTLTDVGNNGSSPRPWGTARDDRRGDRQGRFIPTPVGNGPRADSRRIPRAVHPHARGERELTLVLLDDVDGSSPRPWGTGADAPQYAVTHRFIPTPVGNGLRGELRAGGKPVHPHARGERDEDDT